MENKALVTKDALKDLRCSFCSQYLTVGPVVDTSIKENLYKCGRCRDIPSNISMRNFCFEKFANFLKFPCTFDGCEKVLTSSEVEEHEKVCDYRTIQCTRYECYDTFCVKNIESHFIEKHNLSIIKNPLVCDLEKRYHNTFLLVIENPPVYFVVFINHSKISIFSINLFPKRTFKFKAALSSGDNINVPNISFNEKFIEEYDERVHCFNCLNYECQIKYHKYSKIYNESGKNSKYGLEIDTNSIHYVLKNPKSIRYEINIINDTQGIKTDKETNTDITGDIKNKTDETINQTLKEKVGINTERIQNIFNRQLKYSKNTQDKKQVSVD